MTARRVKLLDLPVGDAVARVARDRLEDAEQALLRLKNRKDTEALHDFRVAVRRVRSLLRAYRRWLGRAGGKKVRRRLRELGQATNAGRDAEVQLAWLGSEHGRLARGERAGSAWLARRLKERKRESYRQARRQVRADFARAADLTRKRLDDEHDGTLRFRQALGILLREHARDLETRLSSIHSAGDEEEAHEARICAKRLRYLLEPIRNEVRESRPSVTRLKGLQELLGDLHDAHVMAAELAQAVEEVATEKARRLHELALAGDDARVRRERRRDERLGLIALATRQRARRDRLFARLANDWLSGAGAPFFAELEVLATAIAVPGSDHVERERKYLLSGMPERAAAAPTTDIMQGWLPGKRLRERLRRVRDGRAERYYRTVKLGAGITRVELEEETTRELFEALWPHTDGCRVLKRRHHVPDGDRAWEIDVFCDRELVLAEIELPTAGAEAVVPDWLAPHVVRDVTGDPAYENLTLAR